MDGRDLPGNPVWDDPVIRPEAQGEVVRFQCAEAAPSRKREVASRSLASGKGQPEAVAGGRGVLS